MLSWLNNVDSFTLAHARSYEFAFSVISGIDNNKLMTVLSMNEQSRLIHHSTIIEKIIDSKLKYIELANKDNNLYLAIKELILRLKKGGEHGLFDGKDNKAGDTAINGLEIFRKIWDQLSSHQQETACENKEFSALLTNKINNIMWGDDCVEELAKAFESILSYDGHRFIEIKLEKEQNIKFAKIYFDDFTNYKTNLNTGALPVFSMSSTGKII